MRMTFETRRGSHGACIGNRAMERILAAGSTMTGMLAAAIALTAAVPSVALAKPMQFQIVEQKSRDADAGSSAAIFASGDIDEGAANRLEALVEREGIKEGVVYFDSSGGLVVESIRLGQYIRKHGLGTSVQKMSAGAGRAMCASACVYAYAGGVARYLDDAEGRIGVHQYYAAKPVSASTGATALPKTPPATDKDDLKIAQLLGSVIVAHLQQMGISSALYVAAAMTDSGDMLWMDRKDAESFDLVNNGELPPKAEIRLTEDGHPYLLISQVADKGVTRVTISCDSQGITLAGGATGDVALLRQMRGQAVRNALEIDGMPVYSAVGQEGMVEPSATQVETRRTIDNAMLTRVDSARTLGFSVDGIGGRWSREIEVGGLRDSITYYTRTCAYRR